MRVAYAFSPASISSFFSPYIVDNPLECGAIGGGFPLNVGVRVSVRVENSDNGFSLVSKVNGRVFDSFIVSKVLELLGVIDVNYRIEVDQFIDVPVGCGYGTSGASAIAVTMALCRALGFKKTFIEMARIAHLVDYYCGTGLGTVSGICGGVGGVRIIVKPGGPGYAVVDKIFIPNDCYIVSVAFNPIDKRRLLKDRSFLSFIEVLGKRVLNEVLRDPSLEVFFKCCRDFALKSGLMTVKVKSLLDILDSAGFNLATQNMIGEAVHILVYKEDLGRVRDILKFHLGDDGIVIVAGVEDRGPRYLDGLTVS
ncbi:MAG: hypothetical protein NDF57_01530 [archaeon GBS-70-058]|nr:hypothetical protein [Candidatus Culexarchaeum nevadense]